MSEIWKAQPNKVYQSWIDTIEEESSDKLNEWEVDFITTIGQRLYVGMSLTEGQADKLEQIYVKYTS